jgi:hypothetical protein
VATDPGVGTPPRKAKGKTPTWYYVAGAVGLVVVYYLYSKSKASSAATTAAATTAAAGTSSGAGTSAGSYGNAGDLAALAPYLSQTAANSTPTAGSGAGTIPTGQVQGGGGYEPAGGQPGSTVAGANGVTYQWVPGSALATLGSAGVPLFEQTTPGVFTPWNVNTYVPNTALYQQVPSGS